MHAHSAVWQRQLIIYERTRISMKTLRIDFDIFDGFRHVRGMYSAEVVKSRHAENAICSNIPMSVGSMVLGRKKTSGVFRYCYF